MSFVLRVGLIGAGKHGSRYARHLCNDLRGEVNLVGMARRDAVAGRRQSAEWGCRYEADYRDLISAPDVDAVIVVVPPTLHRAICEVIAAARKPALFEKPAAASVADARAMLACLAAAGVPAMVAQTLRYNSVVRALLAASAEIGPVHAVRLSQRFEPSPLGWIDDPSISGGGMILHTGVHSFDLVRLFTGREALTASCDAVSVVTEVTEDNWVAHFGLGGGALASVAGSRATRSRTGPIEVVGAQGLLQGDHVLGQAARVLATTVTPLPVAAPAATVREVVRDFAAAVRSDRPLPIPLLEGARAVAMAEACYRSLRQRRTVEVERIEP
jgi:predicted dehydrogenase